MDMRPGTSPGMAGTRPWTWAGRAGRWAAAAAGAALVLTGCHAAGRSGASLPTPRLTITSGDLTFAVGGRESASDGAEARGVPIDTRPDQGVHVRVSGGSLTRVTVTDGSGRAAPGGLDAGGDTWRSTWALTPSRRYEVVATARSRQGRAVAARWAFRTLTPGQTIAASTWLGANQVYGVGMPIILSFSQDVVDKAAVERSLQIWSTKPVTGSWYWVSSRQVWFRPRHYWPSQTDVRFVAHLAGVEAAPGVYGTADLSQQFRIGNSLIAVANAATHDMRVWYQGRLVADWPVSTGRPGLATPDGRYLAFAMGNPVDMNSATFGVKRGDPGYYNLLVYDSVQFTFDGDYVHSAPWSVSEQGYANVSHGCVNLAPADAAWYYRRSLIGDPITIVGSPRSGVWGDGWTIWFLSWRKLLAGSATGRAVRVDSAGSQFAPTV